MRSNRRRSKAVVPIKKVSPMDSGCDPEMTFGSFLFWKPLLPAIDDDLKILLESPESPKIEAKNRFKYFEDIDQLESVEFSEYNYWKMPVPALEAELIETLR